MLDERRSLGPDDLGPAVAEVPPLLVDGQRLDQPTFHELYSRTPEKFRAELIDGVVNVMSSPGCAERTVSTGPAEGVAAARMTGGGPSTCMRIAGI